MYRPKSCIRATLNLNVDVRGEVMQDLYHSRGPISTRPPATVLKFRASRRAACVLQTHAGFMSSTVVLVLVIGIVLVLAVFVVVVVVVAVVISSSRSRTSGSSSSSSSLSYQDLGCRRLRSTFNGTSLDAGDACKGPSAWAV